MHRAEMLIKINDSKVPLGMLLSMIHRSSMIYLNQRMKDFDLTAGQYPFIIVLSDEDGVTQEELAAYFHIDKGTVARAVKKLEEKKYVYRKVDNKNRRRYHVYLTDKGRDALPKITDIYKDWEDSVCCKYSEDEYDQLMKILKILAMKSLEKIDKNGEK